MISKNISNTKDYEKQLFDTVNELTSAIWAHGNNPYWHQDKSNHDEFLSKIYELAQKWHKIFTESCHSQGGF